jgi:hypothetical protein
LEEVKERDRQEDAGVIGTSSLWILKTTCEGADWIQLAQDKAKWQVLVTTVTNLLFP